MNVKPANGHLLIAKCTPPHSTVAKSGIDVQGSWPGPTTYGIVIAAADDVKDAFKPGDVVYYRTSAAAPILIDGAEVTVFVHHSQVMGTAQGAKVEREYAAPVLQSNSDITVAKTMPGLKLVEQ